jgi:hypothetical protein
MPEEEMMTVQIHDATPHDANGMRQVQEHTWLATYPNAELQQCAEVLSHVDRTSRRANRAYQWLNTSAHCCRHYERGHRSPISREF